MTGWHTTLHGTPAGFATPAWLWVALGALVVGTAATLLAARRRQTARGWVAPRLAGRLVSGRAYGRQVARTILWTLGMALLACALARPQFGGHAEQVRRRGSDVVVVLDASRSMLAGDVAPDRIGRAKLEVESLLDELAGDRVGLVTFSTDAFVQMPLTTDYAAARTFLRQIDPRQLPQGGTNIGAGLRQAQQLLSSANDKGARTVLLFSDGEDWQGDAVAAAAALKQAGTTVYTVAVGTKMGAPITSASGRNVVTRMDPSGLGAVAKAGGGAMWQGQGAIGNVAARLTAAQKSELEERRVVVYRERFQLVAAAGLVLLALAAIAGGGRRRRAHGIASAAAAAAMMVALCGARADAAEWTRAPEPTTSAGVQHWRDGKYGDALSAFDRVKRKGPEAPTVAYDRATALYKLGRFEEARREFESAAGAGGSVGADAAYGLGDTLAKLGDTNGAMAAYRRALEEKPQHADARHNLEVLLRKQDEKKQQQKDQQKQDQQKQGAEQQEQQKQSAHDKQQQAQNKQNQQKQQNQQNQQQKQQAQNQQQQQQQQQGQDEQQQQRQEQQQQNQRQNAQNPQTQQHGSDGQQQQVNNGSQPQQPRELDRGGFGQPRSPEARRMLDSLQRDARVLPVWRFDAHQPRRMDETDKDW